MTCHSTMLTNREPSGWETHGVPMPVRKSACSLGQGMSIPPLRYTVGGVVSSYPCSWRSRGPIHDEVMGMTILGLSSTRYLGMEVLMDM